MTQKRFTYEYDEYNGNLFDNKMNTFYHIEDSEENIKILSDRLNCLVDENEELKKILNQAIKQMEVEIDKNSIRYYMSLMIDCELYKKIKEILWNGN